MPMKAAPAFRIDLPFILAIAFAGAVLLAVNLHVQWWRYQLYRLQGVGFADPACAAAYCDYSVFWLAGLLARHQTPATIYDSAAFFRFGAATLKNHGGFLPFFYPPTALLPASLMSLPPLAFGYYAFSVVSLGVSVVLLRLAGLPRLCIAIGLASPAVTWCLYLGQFGLLCGAMLIYGLARLEHQPKRAGGMLAMLCIKPQYALLVPVAVLARRNWRALAAGAATLALLIVVSLGCFGWHSWRSYLFTGRGEAAAVLNAPFSRGYEALGSSVFWMVRSFGAGLSTSYLAQAAASLIAAGAVWRLWHHPAVDVAARLATTVFLTLLASPYGYTDDLAAYAIMLPVLARRATPWRNIGLGCLWLAPATVPEFVRHFGFLPTPLFILGAVAMAVNQQGEVQKEALLF